MEIAKEKRGIEIGYRFIEKREPKRMKEKKGFFENYGLFTAMSVFTLTFSVINIILIMNFFSIIANF